MALLVCCVSEQHKTWTPYLLTPQHVPLAPTPCQGLQSVHHAIDCPQVELFVICKPEDSDALLLELVELEKALYSELGLHYRVLDMPTGDLGAPAHRKIDFEVRRAALRCTRSAAAQTAGAPLCIHSASLAAHLVSQLSPACAEDSTAAVRRRGCPACSALGRSAPPAIAQTTRLVDSGVKPNMLLEVSVVP